MPRASVFLSLGSNQGQRKLLLRRALEELDSLEATQVSRISSLYESKAWGKTDQEDFYNLVILLETDFTPMELLSRTQEIEKKLGRVPTERWGPRTMDIDLLLYNDICLDEPRLRLPHPYMLQRRFVLEPLLEIAPELCIDNKPLEDYIEVVNDKPLKKIGRLW
ncbi:MAG TPA: 2-amino-4-hydroxy-6-hydroxymethyldihydropteridine diphosphokinase [Clostridia bacterium]|nr:2-amino-4-hydroxy-6-hydroxymethyldihydropteridine diphosphokinase [Clostridia bacterium]